MIQVKATFHYISSGFHFCIPQVLRYGPRLIVFAIVRQEQSRDMTLINEGFPYQIKFHQEGLLQSHF